MTLSPLIAYEAGPETDLLLLDWWHRLRTAGELHQTFGAYAETLSAWLERLQAPRLLLYSLRTTPPVGIACAFVVQQMMDAALLTLWIAPEARRSPAMLARVREGYAMILTKLPVVVGITREALLSTHAKWGYRVVGRIQGIRDGEDGWLVELTPEAFHRVHAERGADEPRIH